MHTKPVKFGLFILVSPFYKNMSHYPLYKIEYLLQLKNIKKKCYLLKQWQYILNSLLCFLKACCVIYAY